MSVLPLGMVTLRVRFRQTTIAPARITAEVKTPPAAYGEFQTESSNNGLASNVASWAARYSTEAWVRAIGA